MPHLRARWDARCPGTGSQDYFHVRLAVRDDKNVDPRVETPAVRSVGRAGRRHGVRDPVREAVAVIDQGMMDVRWHLPAVLVANAVLDDGAGEQEAGGLVERRRAGLCQPGRSFAIL